MNSTQKFLLTRLYHSLLSWKVFFPFRTLTSVFSPFHLPYKSRVSIKPPIPPGLSHLVLISTGPSKSYSIIPGTHGTIVNPLPLGDVQRLLPKYTSRDSKCFKTHWPRLPLGPSETKPGVIWVSSSSRNRKSLGRGKQGRFGRKKDWSPDRSLWGRRDGNEYVKSRGFRGEVNRSRRGKKPRNRR